MGTLEGKVAVITGAARGQGRSHAVRLAEEGADVIAIDIAAQIESVPYPMATPEDLEETVRLVQKAGTRCLPVRADVRDIHAMAEAVQLGIATFGGIDIVVANAGVMHFASGEESLAEAAQVFADASGVMLTGVFNTIRVCQEPLIEQGRGGSIVITSSTAGLKGMLDGRGGLAAYTASKHGVVGLMRGYAKLLGPHNIRVNTIHPCAVSTPMIINDEFAAFAAATNTMAAVTPRVLPVGVIESIDVSEALVWLVSDAARYITGIMLPVDAGVTCP